MFGFYRIAVATPKIKIADPIFNVDEHIRLAAIAQQQGAQLILFPELSLTGVSCGDLFTQPLLLEAVEEAIAQIFAWSQDNHITIILGAPRATVNTPAIDNTAMIFAPGMDPITRPKSYIPPDHPQARIFTTAQESPNLYHFSDSDLTFSVIFEDEIFAPHTAVVKNAAHAGANLVLCLSNNPYIAGTQTKIWNRAEVVSAQHRMAFAVANPGVGESSSNYVYAGNSLIAEDGALLAVSEIFANESTLIYADIDAEGLNIQRLQDRSFSQSTDSFLLEQNEPYILPPVVELNDTYRKPDPAPFVPDDDFEKRELCEDILDMQASALIQRLDCMNAQYAVLGLSGGLDSTLALLATHRAFVKSNRKTQNILAITMPGFGTGKRTYTNACALAKSLKISLEEIDITASCKQHFDDIKHALKETTIVFENAQARERTQILLSIANRHNALMVGTGDLSEIALGWSTFNGDHISMYGINAGVPKTLVRAIVTHVAEHTEIKGLGKVLKDIVDTPISPELLPPAKGHKKAVAQPTEDILGPYELHDFFLWNLIALGFMPPKVLFLADKAFQGKYEHDFIKEKLVLFIRRFFGSQFKRNCAADAPMILPIALSQRGDWQMPSDACANIWLDSLENL